MYHKVYAQNISPKISFSKAFILFFDTAKVIAIFRKKIQNMTRIIALVNHKGGVGKTTTTLNLGKALSLLGKKILLVDIDPQANLSQSLGFRDIENSIYDVICENKKPEIKNIASNFDLLPADLNLATAEAKLLSEQMSGYIKLKKGLNPYISDYDYVLIDCPPSLGILTINALALATDMMVVAETEFLSVTGLQTILELRDRTLETLNAHLKFTGILFTQYNRTSIGKGVIESIKQSYPNKVFNTYIRENVKISEASASRQDIFTYDDTSLAALDYKDFADEFLIKIN